MREGGEEDIVHLLVDLMRDDEIDLENDESIGIEVLNIDETRRPNLPKRKRIMSQLK